MKRVRALVLAGSLAGVASSAWAEDVCRKFVPSAGVTVEVPCKPKAEEPEPVAVSPDAMERRDGHELQGNAYTVITLGDTAACEKACLADAKCVAVEYYQKKSGCGLFDVVPPVKRAKFIDVSIRKRAAGAAPVEAQAPAVVPVAAGGPERPKWCGSQPAFNAAETLVCSEADLSALDVELERVFGVAMAAVPTKAERAKLQAAEDGWAATRDACQANRVCVKAAYELRIEQLRQPRAAVPKR